MDWLNFPSAKSSLVIDTNLTINEILEDQRKRETIDKHPFNQCLQLMIPLSILDHAVDNQKFPHLNKMMSDGGVNAVDCSGKNEQLNYFLVKCVPLHSLIHPLLIEYYVKKGKLYGLSINTQVQKDDCVSLSSGVLTLSLTDMTYRRLGLTGFKSIIVRAKKLVQKYIVTIDLLSESCSDAERKSYQRTFRLLRNSNLKFDLLIKWEPLGERHSPGSIVKFFEYLRNNPGPGGGYLLNENEATEIQVNLCRPLFKRFSKKNIQCPRDLMEENQGNDCKESIAKPDDIPVLSKTDGIDEQFANPADIPVLSTIDWIGGQFAGIEMAQGLIDPEVTSFYVEESDSSLLKSMECIQCTGFFTPQDVRLLISDLVKLVKLYDQTELPFVALIVNGFEHCPISWDHKRNEHGCKVNGENLYGLVVRKSDANLIWRVADEYDFGIEKL